MHVCKLCEREFKSKAGLSSHTKKCSIKPNDDSPITLKEETDAINAIAKHTKEPVLNVVKKVSELKGEKNEVANNAKLSDNTLRKIAKLEDARKSTYDAHAKHLIEVEIKQLRESNT